MSDPVIRAEATIAELWRRTCCGSPQAAWLLNLLLDDWDAKIAGWAEAGGSLPDRLAGEVDPEMEMHRKQRASASTALHSLRQGRPITATGIAHIRAVGREVDAIEILATQGRLHEWADLAEENTDGI